MPRTSRWYSPRYVTPYSPSNFASISFHHGSESARTPSRSKITARNGSGMMGQGRSRLQDDKTTDNRTMGWQGYKTTDRWTTEAGSDVKRVTKLQRESRIVNRRQRSEIEPANGRERAVYLPELLCHIAERSLAPVGLRQ